LRKSNKKLYVLSVVPIIAILYFLTATGIQDDSMWDISTNEYYQQGANFELFALTYEECQKWPVNVQQARNCPTSSNDYASIYGPINPETGAVDIPTIPSPSWWDNIFTPTPTPDPADINKYPTPTIFSCKSNVVMYYKDDQRNSWRQYGSTWTDIGSLDLSSTTGGGKITDIKGDVYMKCDWRGNGEIQLKSGTTRTVFLDGFLVGSGSGAGQGTGMALSTPKTDSLDRNVDLKNGVKTLVGTIAELNENDIDRMEQYLKPIVKGKYLGITFGVTLNPTFVLNGYSTVDKTGSTFQHMSSMKFTKLLEAPTIPKVATSRGEATEIISITHNTLDIKNNANSLDTSLDPQCNTITCNTKHQIKIVTTMSKYLPDEGSPLIKITDPKGKTVGVTAIMGKTQTGSGGHTQYFTTYYSLQSNSHEGTWKVEMTNVNRSNVANSSFYVQNIDPTPVDCPEYDKNGNPIIYQQRDECYTGNTPSPDEVTQLEDLRVGVIWKVKDGGGKTLDEGNSLVDGNSIIPQLTELALISEIVDDRSGDTQKFYQIMIQPIIQFDDKSQDINKYRYAQSYNPLNIPITLSIPDDKGAGTKTKYIERTASGTGYYKLLGTGYMSQADADFLADNAGYEVGDRFTVEAKIGGEFTLTSNTNKDYNFVFDDVKITKEFQYGIKGESIPSEQKQKDDEWNDCLEQIDQFGRNKIPNYDGWNDGFQCSTVDEYDKQQCENNGMAWSTVGIIDYGGYCVDDVGLPPNPTEDELKTAQEKCEDSQSNSGSYTWNVGQEMCIFNPDPTSTQPRNGGEDDDDVDDDVGSSSGNLQLCSPGQSISDCIKDLQINNQSLINFDDNTIMIIGIIFAVLILVAIIARRRKPSYGGLMNRYG
jgi:hypothetical protein